MDEYYHNLMKLRLPGIVGKSVFEVNSIVLDMSASFRSNVSFSVHSTASSCTSPRITILANWNVVKIMQSFDKWFLLTIYQNAFIHTLQAQWGDIWHPGKHPDIIYLPWNTQGTLILKTLGWAWLWRKCEEWFPQTSLPAGRHRIWPQYICTNTGFQNTV